MSTPRALYERRLGNGELSDDPAQRRAVRSLQRLYDELLTAEATRRGWRRLLAGLAGRAQRPPRGVYLWGSVGRGKTMLMDLFFGCLPFEDKLRQHFHRFMGGVHEDLKAVRRHENPLELVADRIAARARIICFDEFAVTDIADAMILGNLFTALFERGVTLAATSNLRPDQLYADGLQRQRFLGAIEMIEHHTEVVQVGGDLDYRLRALEQADVYQQPPSAEADRRLADFFNAIAPDESDAGGSIELLGRQLDYRHAADGVIWFDFPQICDGPRSQSDYIELSRVYQTVLVSNVPRFTRMLENQARRFIALVDEFYDRRVKLILSAEALPEQLYAGERLKHDFLRTASRLREMQSHDYLASPHRP